MRKPLIALVALGAISSSPSSAMFNEIAQKNLTPLGMQIAERMSEDPYFVTGNQLLELKAERLGAMMYVVGVIDRDQGARVAWTGIKYCIPNGVTRGQALDLVLRHLEEVPAERQKSAAYLVRAALLKAYPC